MMRLTIFGASGQTGRHLIQQALAAGHTVTAVVRDPTRLPIRHQRLKLVVADVLDPAAIQPAVAGADAVISALGPQPPRNRSSIISAGTARILDAMRATGTSRLVVISAAPVAADDHGTTLGYRLLAGPLLRRLLGGLYADMAIMEDTIKRSGVDWTIMRPPWLFDGPQTGTYRQAKDSTCAAAPASPGPTWPTRSWPAWTIPTRSRRPSPSATEPSPNLALIWNGL
jgi:putative NADH-flavin reductase